jgi:hypothetical protein
MSGIKNVKRLRMHYTNCDYHFLLINYLEWNIVSLHVHAKFQLEIKVENIIVRS